MVAFALPIIWMATGLLGLAKVYSVSSRVTLTTLLLDRWLAKKCVKLGIRPDMFGIGLSEEEVERRRVMYMLGKNLDDDGQPVESRLLILNVEPHQVEGMSELVGTWAFVGKEFDGFVDGIRHKELELGIGGYATRLKELIEGKEIQYDELSFLWERYEFDFDALRKLSDARMNDAVFRKAAGLSMFG